MGAASRNRNKEGTPGSIQPVHEEACCSHHMLGHTPETETHQTSYRFPVAKERFLQRVDWCACAGSGGVDSSCSHRSGTETHGACRDKSGRLLASFIHRDYRFRRAERQQASFTSFHNDSLTPPTSSALRSTSLLQVTAVCLSPQRKNKPKRSGWSWINVCLET